MKEKRLGTTCSESTRIECIDKYQDTKMSKRVLLNRLKEYGLTHPHRKVNEAIFRHNISRELEGARNLLGYRAMWRKLHLKYDINVPRSAVEIVLRELDPVENRLMRAHRLKRRRSTIQDLLAWRRI